MYEYDPRRQSRSNYRWITLPPDFNPIDCTVDEAASWRRESRWTTHKKIREGVYESFLDGRIRKIVFASVVADREAAIARSKNPFGKRRPGGQLRKPCPEEEQATATGESRTVNPRDVHRAAEKRRRAEAAQANAKLYLRGGEP